MAGAQGLAYTCWYNAGVHLGQRTRADLTLFLVAVIWGSSFVAGRIVAHSIGFFLFNGLRFFVAAGFLLILMRCRVHIRRQDIPLILLAAIVLFGASAFQQAGMVWTTAANAGFFTGLYVIIVPLFLWIFFRQVVHAGIWIAAAIAILGALLLSTGALALNLAPGDALELVGAFFWAMHLIIVGIAARRIHPLVLTFGQLIIAGSLHLAFSGFFEENQMSDLSSSAWAIAYTGIFSIGLGYAWQAYGQRHAPPADAAIILSMEAVFAAILGVIILKENLSAVQWLGCSLIFAAILIAQFQGSSPANLQGQEIQDLHQNSAT